MPVKIDGDDGYLDVEVSRKGEPPAAVTLDLFEAVSVYDGLHREHEGGAALGDAWCAWLAEKGLPGLSHGKALALAKQVIDRADEFAKKNGLASATADSNGSTGSPSSAPAPPTNSCGKPA